MGAEFSVAVAIPGERGPARPSDEPGRFTYHSRAYGEPTTRSAMRIVELFPQTVGILRDLQPLHVAPDAPVFTSTTGAPIEPKAFSEHWYDALRALGIRVGGLYYRQDTHVSLASQPVRDAWWGREAETGVALARAHYARWMPQDERSELRRLTSVDAVLFGGDFAKRPREGLPASPKKGANLLKLQMRGGGLEPDKSHEIVTDSRVATGTKGHEEARSGPSGATSPGRRLRSRKP